MGFSVLVTVLLAATTGHQGAAGAVDGKKGIRYTYPMPPHEKPADPMRVSPGHEVPEHPDHYKWVLTGKINGKQVFQSAVPVYTFDELTSRPTRIGEIPVGTELKLDGFRRLGATLYYQVPFEGSKRPAFVTGLAIEPTAYTPPVQ